MSLMLNDNNESFGKDDSRLLPLVSVICLTYNHKGYIKDALDSFLCQKTNFPYEIVIHDDASNDGTSDILRSYQSLYPEKLRVIYQESNQYSKFGFAKVLRAVIDSSHGTYLALCEGDDYWIDENKLQLQVDALRANNVGMAFHPAAERRGDDINWPSLEGYEYRVYPTPELIRTDFHFIQTSSVVFSKSSLNEKSYDIMSRSPVADVIIRLISAGDKGAVCITQVGSVYRVMSEGSWSSSMRSAASLLKYTNSMLSTIDELDNYFSQKYSTEFDFYKRRFVSSISSNKEVLLKDKLALINRLKIKNKIYSYMFYVKHNIKSLFN